MYKFISFDVANELFGLMKLALRCQIELKLSEKSKRVNLKLMTP